MKQRAFLIDISNYQGDMKKYRIVGQLLELMVQGITTRDDHDSRFLVSTLEGEGIVEIVDQFHTAFFDLDGFQIKGLAKLEVRLLINLRGLEMSIWTSCDEIYSIIISLSVKQLERAICTLTGIKDSASQEFKQMLTYLREAEYSLLFPSYTSVKLKLNNEN